MNEIHASPPPVVITPVALTVPRLPTASDVAPPHVAPFDVAWHSQPSPGLPLRSMKPLSQVLIKQPPETHLKLATWGFAAQEPSEPASSVWPSQSLSLLSQVSLVVLGCVTAVQVFTPPAHVSLPIAQMPKRPVLHGRFCVSGPSMAPLQSSSTPLQISAFGKFCCTHSI